MSGRLHRQKKMFIKTFDKQLECSEASPWLASTRMVLWNFWVFLGSWVIPWKCEIINYGPPLSTHCTVIAHHKFIRQLWVKKSYLSLNKEHFYPVCTDFESVHIWNWNCEVVRPTSRIIIISNQASSEFSAERKCQEPVTLYCYTLLNTCGSWPTRWRSSCWPSSSPASSTRTIFWSCDSEAMASFVWDMWRTNLKAS